MRSPFPLLLSLLLLAGCQQAAMVKQTLDTAFAESVHLYCRLPEPVRLANRARIAAKVAPDRIEIHCASGSGAGG